MSSNRLSQLICFTLSSTKHIKPRGHYLLNTNRGLKRIQYPSQLTLQKIKNKKLQNHSSTIKVPNYNKIPPPWLKDGSFASPRKGGGVGVG